MAAPLIYLGTTSEDLHATRHKVEDSLKAAGYGLLHAASIPSSPGDVAFREHLLHCLGVVLVIGTCRGACRESGESWAEFEYRTARELKLPCYTFLLHEDYPSDADAADTPEMQAAQFRFRHSIQQEPRGWELIESPERLVTRLRLITYRLEELRETSSSARETAVSVPEAGNPLRTVSEHTVASLPTPPPLPPWKDGGETGLSLLLIPKSPPASTTPLQKVSPPPVRTAMASPRRKSRRGLLVAVIGFALLLVGLGLAWQMRQLVSNERNSMRAATSSHHETAPAPAVPTEPRSTPEPTASTPPKSTTASNNPDASHSSKSAGTEAARAEFQDPTKRAVNQGIIRAVANLQAMIFSKSDPLTATNRRSHAIHCVAESLRERTEDLQVRMGAYADMVESDANAANSAKALAAFVREDYQKAIDFSTAAEGEDFVQSLATRTEIKLLRAHCEFLLGNHDAAHEQYASLFKNTEKESFVDWWLLAMLHENKRDTTEDKEFAEGLMREILKKEDASSFPNPLNTARALRRLASTLSGKPETWEEREMLLRRAVQVMEKEEYARNSPELARIYIDLAGCLTTLRPGEKGGALKGSPRVREAEVLVQKAMQIDAVKFGSESLPSASDLIQYACVLLHDNPPQAESQVRSALRLLDPAHRSSQEIIQAWRVLEGILMGQGRYPEAEEVLQESLQALGERKKPLYFDLIYQHYRLAKLYELMGSPSKQEANLRKAMSLGEPTKSHEAIPYSYLQNGLITLLRTTNREAEAVELILEGRRLRPLWDPMTDREHAFTLADAANLLVQIKRKSEAAPLYKEAVEHALKLPPADAVLVVRIICDYTDLREDEMPPSEFESLLRKAASLDETTSFHERKGTPAHRLADHLMKTKRVEEAVRFLEEAIPVLEKSRSADVATLLPYCSLGDGYMRLKRVKEAERVFSKAAAAVDAMDGIGPSIHSHVLGYHALSLAILGRATEAESQARRAIRMLAAQKNLDDETAAVHRTIVKNYTLIVTGEFGLSDSEAFDRVLKIESGEPVPDLRVKNRKR